MAFYGTPNMKFQNDKKSYDINTLLLEPNQISTLVYGVFST